MAVGAEELDFLGLRNPGVGGWGGKKCILHLGTILSSLTNEKGWFTEQVPGFTEVKKSHKDIRYLKVVTIVESSL